MDSPYTSRVVCGLKDAAPPPPMHVHYIPQGEIRDAWRSAEVPYRKGGRRRATHRAGLAYEKRVHEWVFNCSSRHSVELSPWFCFIDASGARHYCQPDALLVSDAETIVVESKIRWTTDAWWQLRKLYIPVLSVALKKPQEHFVPLCVCKSFDPAFPTPEPVALRTSVALCTPSRLNVMVVR